MPEATERSCGGCTACCYTHSVKEGAVTTGFYDLCTHCTEGVGCAIYEARPLSCQVYQCLWRSGSLPDELRPDKSGIILDVWPFEDLGATFLNIWESIPGSLETETARALIEHFMSTGRYILWIIKQDEDTLFFPDDVEPDVRAYIEREFSEAYRTLTKKPE
jgi:hypothetical protein